MKLLPRHVTVSPGPISPEVTPATAFSWVAAIWRSMLMVSLKQRSIGACTRVTVRIFFRGPLQQRVREVFDLACRRFPKLFQLSSGAPLPRLAAVLYR